MSKVTEIHIPVRSGDGREGTVEIVKGINSRTITIRLEDEVMVLEQSSVESVPHYQTGVVTGKLHRVMESRKVSGGKWSIREFVISFGGDKRGEQHRLMQAVGDAIEQLNGIKEGANMVCEVRFLGKEWRNKKRDFALDYWNLDEVTAIHTF